MDGNARWAKQKGLPIFRGHEAGISAVKRLLHWCEALSIPAVTVHLFCSSLKTKSSSHHWRRSLHCCNVNSLASYAIHTALIWNKVLRVIMTSHWLNCSYICLIGRPGSCMGFPCTADQLLLLISDKMVKCGAGQKYPDGLPTPFLCFCKQTIYSQAVAEANGIPDCMQVFALSTENWHRGEAEVNLILKMIERVISQETEELVQAGIRVSFIGNRQALSSSLQGAMRRSGLKAS